MRTRSHCPKIGYRWIWAACQNVLKLGRNLPGYRCIELNTVGPSAKVQIRSTLSPISLAASNISSTYCRLAGSAANTICKDPKVWSAHRPQRLPSALMSRETAAYQELGVGACKVECLAAIRSTVGRLNDEAGSTSLNKLCDQAASVACTRKGSISASRADEVGGDKTSDSALTRRGRGRRSR